jgi:hypothetical protein
MNVEYIKNYRDKELRHYILEAHVTFETSIRN